MRLPKRKLICMTPTTNPLIIKTFHPAEHEKFTKIEPPRRRGLTVDDSIGLDEEQFVNESEDTAQEHDVFDSANSNESCGWSEDEY